MIFSLSPYSLGKLIDWKPAYYIYFRIIEVYKGAPYSLGKLIDWKRDAGFRWYCISGTPYSLGKLIDWKLQVLGVPRVHCWDCPPYSLGKLIDWKPTQELNTLVLGKFNLPTR